MQYISRLTFLHLYYILIIASINGSCQPLDRHICPALYDAHGNGNHRPQQPLCQIEQARHCRKKGLRHFPQGSLLAYSPGIRGTGRGRSGSSHPIGLHLYRTLASGLSRQDRQLPSHLCFRSGSRTDGDNRIRGYSGSASYADEPGRGIEERIEPKKEIM